MSQEEAVIDSYDENNIRNYKALMTAYKGLRNFADVTSWDQQASAEVEKIVNAIRELDSRIADVSRRLKQVQEERAQKNFVARLFSSQSTEKSLVKLSQEYSQLKTALEGFASELQEAIDFTPNSAEEKTNLLKELKARKKELQVEKREVAAAMKAIRTGARKESAHAGMVAGLYYDSKVASVERRHIRYQKEAALRPHEDAKTAIERQLIQVDKDILWAEKFS